MADARLEAIVRNCRNATPSSCGGYLEPTATGQPGAYVSTILLTTVAVRTRLDDRLNRIAYAAYLCGENQGARYKKIYIGWKASHIPKNHVGGALACAPYVTLSEGAFSNISPESEILELSTEDWLSRVGLSEADEPRYELKTLTGPHIAWG